MQYLVYIMFIVLIGFIVWLWQRDKDAETKRLYRWQDDMFDRLNSGDIHVYAMIRRLKYDMDVQTVDAPKTKEKLKKADEPREPQFVH